MLELNCRTPRQCSKENREENYQLKKQVVPRESHNDTYYELEISKSGTTEA